MARWRVDRLGTGGSPAADSGTIPDNAATAAPQTDANDGTADIVVTGYRSSLAKSTNAKRAATGFTDSIFAEDIGKFPDTNIAESFNRISGVTITRDVTGKAPTSPFAAWDRTSPT